MDAKEFLELKEKWGLLYRAEINGIEFYWRPISKREYNDIVLMDIDDDEKESLICSRCVLRPNDFNFDTGFAGIGATLAQYIYSTSCLDEESIINTIHAYESALEGPTTEIERKMSLIVHEAFHEYTIEEILNWPNEKLIARYAQAKWILKELRGVEIGLEIQK
jgi:hypothetical protein